MSGGGIIVARNLWDDPAFQNEPFSEREAWIWMICEASWKPRQKRVGKVIVSLDRGQLATSVRFMAEAFLWHRNKADRFLKRLQKCNLIRAESGTGVNVITICKYNEYQLSPKSFGTEAGQKRDRSGTNENKGNKGNKDNPQAPNVGKRSDDDRIVQILSLSVSRPVSEAFVAHRRDMKKPMTENAANAMLKKLEGHPDPDAVLTDSIANGWQGIFPEKTKGSHHAKSKPSRADFDAAHREYARRVSAGEIDFGPDPSDPFSGG